MKIKDCICDVCGETVYKRARHQYRIKKRFWQVDSLWKNMDLCEDCYINLIRVASKSHTK